ncbi:MAG: hypothetical protein VX438_10200, partial [Planctomycetota bacterium]|nr:hypothetical protein [Planctomycetota bacterium]
MITRLKALQLLSKCRGDEIWSLEVCQREGVPQEWIDVLADATESGFQSDLETLYVDQQPINQFHGVQDVKLAYHLGDYLGVDISKIPL